MYTATNVGAVRLTLLPLSALVSACGSGTAAILSGSGGGGGSSPPAIVNLRLDGTKSSPARIEFELLNTSATVELRYRDNATSAFQRMEHLTRLAADCDGQDQAAGNPVALAPGPACADWDFSAEAGIDPGKFESEVEIEVAIVGQTSGSQLAGGGVGNSLPQVSRAAADVDPGAGEVSGIVLVEATVDDTPGDRADLRVEFSLDGTSWQLARPAQSDATPQFAFTDVVIAEGGTDVAFFWDTAVDLGDADTDVFVRFVPFEDIEGTPEQGALLVSARFHLDNNAEPIAQLFNDQVISNPDQRRGIPVPFRAIDEESDLVEAVFQWRQPDEEFPELRRDELTAILADPELRRANHICTPYPRFARGRVVPLDSTSVRLPELAASESWILAAGLEGSRLELLRSSSIPEPVAWTVNPFAAPVAALPAGDGLTALVLDAVDGRLREIELATGEVLRELATLGPGIPSAMAYERGGKAVLIASDLSGMWRIERLELAGGALRELAVSDGREPGPVRGIASLGANAVAFSAGSSLFFLDYRDPLAPQLGTLLSGLSEPWGVVVDPLPGDRLYLAEREAITAAGPGRILALDLDSHGHLPVVVRTVDVLPANLERPSALALEREGSRLLVVTNELGGGSILFGLDLGTQGGNVSFPIGARLTSEIASVASGPDDLRLATLPTAGALLVAGGIQQRRRIVAYESLGQRAQLDSPLDPVPQAGSAWRIPALPRLRASPAGVDSTFVWNSGADVPSGGSAFLRLLPRDAELGVRSDGREPKLLRAALDVEPLVLDGGFISSPFRVQAFLSVAAADLDGDGDQDLATAVVQEDKIAVFFQSAPGLFDAPPLLLGDAATTSGPICVVTGDLDGDGDQDLVSANRGGATLSAFFQGSPGTFTAPPLSLGAFAGVSIALGDLDGDGDLDLVSANRDASDLAVLFQSTPGRFDLPPLRLGDLSTTNAAVDVALGDLDGDGDLDVVSANRDGHDLSVFFQSSPGSFAASPLVLGDLALTNAPVAVAVGDLDGDGDQDLASANSGGPSLTLFSQAAPGIFGALAVLDVLPSTSEVPRDIALGDLDGDGDQDVVSANGNTATVFYQDVPGRFGPAPLTLERPGTGFRPGSVAAVELDGDGDQDLVCANGIDDDLTLFLQDSPGGFVSTELAASSLAPTIFSVVVGDLERDGDLDLILADEEGLRVFLQGAPGTFAPAFGGRPILTGLGSFALAASDLDGDGDLDLASANFASSLLQVFFQDAPGSFDPTPTVLGTSTVFFPFSVTLADLEGDGDQDLVSANLGNSNLTVFFQTSPGNFAPEPLALGDPSATRSPVSVAAADLDCDGDLDLVSANFSGDDLTIFFQTSPGSFAPTPLVLGGSPMIDGPVSVVAADLDGDGDQDLVSSNQRSQDLTIFFQESPGSFASPPSHLSGVPPLDTPGALAAADLEGDGDPDLVVVDEGSQDLRLFFQRTPGVFDPDPRALAPATNFDPKSLVVNDLDGDGDQDLVSINGFTNALTVFWGGR